MPQLDFGNPLLISQIVWMGIIFAILYYVLSTRLLPQVASVLATRAERIAADLDAAAASKAQADAAVAELMAATRQAREGAQAAIAAAVAEAKAAAAAEAQELGRALDAELARAERGIGEARAAAMGALREVASDTATLVVSRLTGVAPPAERVEHAVGALLAARQG